MSIQRFQRSAPTNADLARYIPGGATIDGFGPNFVDVDLTNDAQLADLVEAMQAAGYAYLQAAPTTTVKRAPLPPAYIQGCDVQSLDAASVQIGIGSARDVSDEGDLIVTAALAVNIAASGAGGLDTGVEAPSTWYAIWIIAGAAVPVAGMFSVSATAPTMPAGYTLKRRVGWVRNNAASTFAAFASVNGRVSYPLARTALRALNAGAAVADTLVDLSIWLPPTATLADLTVVHAGAPGVLLSTAYLQPFGGVLTEPGTFVTAGTGAVATAAAGSAAWSQQTSAAQQLAYKNSDAGAATTIYVRGYVDAR